MKPSLEQSLKTFERKQAIASVATLIVLVGLSLVFNYVHLSAQAEQTAKLISRTIQVEDFREVSLTLQAARLDHFQVVRFISAEPGRSFTLPELADLIPDQSFWRKLATDRIVIEAHSTASASQDKIEFEFNRFNFVPHALALWLLINLVSIPQTRLMKRRIVAQYQRDLDVEKELARSEIARKVRHNIRTPLSALIRLTSSTRSMKPDEAELFGSIVKQIKQLISELDEKPAVSPSATDVSIYDTIREAVRECRLVIPKNIEFESSIDDSICSAVSQFSPHEFRSIISNLITNSIEAIEGSGKITLSARDLGHEIELEVTDTGKGIPPEIVQRIGERGLTVGKPNGSGLGLYHAKTHVESWRGRFRVHSNPREGTTIHLNLPIEKRASWYVPRIRIGADDTVVIVDDQPAIHRLWNLRLDETGFKGKRNSYYSIEEASAAEKTGSSLASRTHYFVDFDFGSEAQTGVAFIKRLPAETNRYLLTGHFDLSEIQDACVTVRCSLIPKSLLADLPLVVIGH